MAYKLVSFAGVGLPDCMTVDDVGTPGVDSALLDTIGGAFNYYGALQRYPRRHSISYKGMYVGSSAVDLDTKVNALYGMLGVYGMLTRQRLYNSDLHTKPARLLSVRHQRPIEHAGVFVAEMDLAFESEAKAWRADLTTDGGNITGSATWNMGIGGNIVCDDPIITLQPIAGQVNALRVHSVAIGVDWTFTDDIDLGSTLEIDCGRQTVKIDGGGKYQYFALNAPHRARGWLPLPVGFTDITLVVTGAAASVNLAWYEKWV